MTEPFFVAVKRELEAEAARLGVGISVEDGQSNSAKQTADIEAAIAGGTQGLILAPNDVNALAPGVEEVSRRGFPSSRWTAGSTIPASKCRMSERTMLPAGASWRNG